MVRLRGKTCHAKYKVRSLALMSSLDGLEFALRPAMALRCCSIGEDDSDRGITMRGGWASKLAARWLGDVEVSHVLKGQARWAESHGRLQAAHLCKSASQPEPCYKLQNAAKSGVHGRCSLIIHRPQTTEPAALHERHNDQLHTVAIAALTVLRRNHLHPPAAHDHSDGQLSQKALLCAWSCTR